MKKLLSILAWGLLLTLAAFIVVSRADPADPPRTLHTAHHFLPPYPNARDRFGFDSGSLSGYDVAQLHAGWYSNWGASLTPAHPDGLTYVQLIRFHAGSDPYDPAQVKVSPNRDTIAHIAAAHPGSLWLMSNEPDSFFKVDPIYPDVYAHVYHEFYHYVKGLDPTALIANGGIVQPTPCRMEYLDIVLDTYLQTYGEPMPVDVWNIHAFILHEASSSWGAKWPPGVDPSCAMSYPIRDGDNVDIFRDNLIAFRQWMKDKGEQDKPLIISEYGVLWPDWLKDEDGRGFPPARVSHFMTQTFDLFLYETYPDVGYPADDYRLVQAWAWYSLSDDSYYNGYLFHSGSKEISPMGETYSRYTAALTDTRYTDLAVQLGVDLSPLQNLTPTTPHDALSVTLPTTGSLANLGKLAAQALVSAPLLGYQATHDVPGRYEQDVGTLPLPSLVLTRSGIYTLALIADPARAITDPRRWNNAVTVTLDTRPDLSISLTEKSLQPLGTLASTMNVTFAVTNSGLWPSPPVSATFYLSNTQGTLLLPPQRFSVPAIGSDVSTNVVEKLDLPPPSDDFYHLKLEVDSDRIVEEIDKGNNHATITIPVAVTVTLQPDVASVLTSTSGHLTFRFAAGTVTTSTQICFIALWIPGLPPGPPLGVSAFRLTAYWGGQPISLTLLRPVTVTWRYSESDVAGLNEDALGLYYVTENGLHRRVHWPAEQHDLEANRLTTGIRQLGRYIFGQGYETYVPLILKSGEGTAIIAQPPASVPAPGGPLLPGLPLRLPPWATPPGE